MNAEIMKDCVGGGVEVIFFAFPRLPPPRIFSNEYPGAKLTVHPSRDKSVGLSGVSRSESESENTPRTGRPSPLA